MLRKRLEETIRKFLTEVSVKQLKQQYPDFEDVIDELTTKVENKYLEFIMKIYSKRKFKLILEQLIELCNLYDKFSKSKKIDAFLKDSEVNTGENDWIKNPAVKDINFFYKKAQKEKMDPLTLLRTFLDIIKHYKTKGEKEKEIKQATKKIYEDSNVLILSPRSREASCFYGKGTKWCISAKNDNMWDSYSDNGIFFAFIFDKNPKEENGRKIAIAFYPYPSTAMEIYDATDKQLKFQDLLNYYGNKKLQTILREIRKNFIGNRQYKFFFFLPGDIIKYKDAPEKVIEKKVDQEFRKMMRGNKVDAEKERILKKDLVLPDVIENLYNTLKKQEEFFYVGDIIKLKDVSAQDIAHSDYPNDLKKAQERRKNLLERRYKVLSIKKDVKTIIVVQNIFNARELVSYEDDELKEHFEKDNSVGNMEDIVKERISNLEFVVDHLDEKYFVVKQLGYLPWREWKKFKLVGQQEQSQEEEPENEFE